MKKNELSLETLDKDLRTAVEACQEKKAADILILDLKGLASFTDYFLICTGTSNRQLKTIVDEIEETVATMKRKPVHKEGYPRGEWILMDYVDFVVHVFTTSSRVYYDLDRLWGDAGRLAVAS